MYPAEEAQNNKGTTEFIALLGNRVPAGEPEVLYFFVDTIRTEAPYTFELARRCMTTGSWVMQEKAKDQFAEALSLTLTGTMEQINKYVNRNSGVVDQILGARWCGQMDMAMWWIIISDELFSDIPDEISNAWYSYRRLHTSILLSKTVSKDCFQEEWFWRGLAVHAAAYQQLTQVDPELQSASSEFLHWAGTHHDPVTVIELTKERGTLDIRILQSALDNNGTVHPLYDGSL